MILAGLTGGIASGKNSVARIMSDLGAKIIDADIISRELVEPNLPAWNDIVSEFGEEILDSKGNIDRTALGNIVFGDKERREALNKILHPKIIDEEYRRIDEIKKSCPDSIIIVNAALLIESGNYEKVDKVIVVTSSTSLAIKRTMARDGLTKDEVALRMKSQSSDEEKLKHADYVIDNNGTFEELQDKVVSLFNSLNSIRSGKH